MKPVLQSRYIESYAGQLILTVAHVDKCSTPRFSIHLGRLTLEPRVGSSFQMPCLDAVDEDYTETCS